MFTRRRAAKFGLFGVLAGLLLAGPWAAPGGDDEVRPGTARPGPAVERAAPPERAVRRALEDAAAAIREEDWPRAAKLLDGVLGAERDRLLTVQREEGGRERPAVVSARREAERLLAALPDAGRRAYEKECGAAAADLLAEARRKKSAELFQRVVDRYLYTEAGVAALAELAELHHAADRHDLAAYHFDRLLRHRGLARWAPTQLIHAAISFSNSGDRDGAAAVGRELLGRAGEGTFPLGLTRAELRAELDKLARPAPSVPWPLYRGDAARSARSTGDAPLLVPDWTIPTARSQETKDWLRQAEERLARQDRPFLSGAVPLGAVAAGKGQELLPLVLFRSHSGIHAVDLRTGKLRWETPSTYSLDRMVRNTKQTGIVSQWVQAHLQTRPNLLLENSTLGTLGTDGAYVFIVDDLAVPPVNRVVIGPRRDVMFGSGLDEAVAASRLEAYDVAVGKIKWQVGGKSREGAKKNELADSHFLGAPLPLGRELYVAVERDRPPVPEAVFLAAPQLAASEQLRDTREVRLAVLHPRTGELESIRTLFTHRRPLRDSARRSQAVHLAYGCGVLVCCAHTGTVVGVDPRQDGVLWSYTYRAPSDESRSEEEKPGWVKDDDGYYVDPAEFDRWKGGVPIIAHGRVVLAAADSPALHCLDARSGEPLWSVPRAGGDLYVAGVARGLVLIVGDGYVRAVDLATGENAWRTDTGRPSGFGAFAGELYYVPLRSGAADKGPEICVIDAGKGEVVAHVRERADPERPRVVPGNLVFFHNQVLSLGPTEIVGLPQVGPRLERIEESLKKNPKDPAGLYLRGTAHEARADTAAAVEDYRAALAAAPPADLAERARARLYEALTDLLRRDFDRGEKYLKEYEELCTSAPAADAPDAERHRRAVERRVTFLVIAAEGREKQGRLADALAYYLDLAQLPTGGELVPVPGDPALKVRLDRWALGRIEQLLKKATPEQRRQLEEELGKRGGKPPPAP
jgi:outer membrane protein assembly factor BamB/tetratricopeptide (TPR) repeat protein